MFLVGQAIDIHKLEQKSKSSQKLGGIEFILDYQIRSHSDGDIILHTIANAIFGALGLEDIGYYFPDNDLKNKDLNSSKIVDFALSEMRKRNMKINNLDLTVISEHLYFHDIKYKIKNNLMTFLNTNNISLKATRWEEDKKMIQCNAIITLISTILEDKNTNQMF